MRVRMVLASFAVCCLLALTAQATVCPRVLALEDLVTRSTLAVEGTLIKQAAYVDPDAGNNIRTRYTLAVTTAYLGAASETLTFTCEGGVLPVSDPPGAQRFTQVDGSPHFATGDSVIVFLHHARGILTPTWMGQGVFDLETDDNGQQIVRRRLGGIHVLQPGDDRRVQPAPPQTTLELASFRAALQATVRAVREGGAR